MHRLAAVFLLVGLTLSASPGPACGGPPSVGPATVLQSGIHLPGCGQGMTLMQCPTGLCAALPQPVATLTATPQASLVIEFTASLHGHTPPPPEPPPPQP